jgi:hypothetical protein
VPAGIRDDRGEDDHADPTGQHVPPDYRKSGQHDRKDQDLAKFDSDVEREERDKQMGPSELEPDERQKQILTDAAIWQ